MASEGCYHSPMSVRDRLVVTGECKRVDDCKALGRQKLFVHSDMQGAAASTHGEVVVPLAGCISYKIDFAVAESRVLTRGQHIRCCNVLTFADVRLRGILSPNPLPGMVLVVRIDLPFHIDFRCSGKGSGQVLGHTAGGTEFHFVSRSRVRVRPLMATQHWNSVIVFLA